MIIDDKQTMTKRFLTIVSLMAALNAPAFTYTTTDLLLVLRKDGLNDVVFNLGNASNYLGLANGTTFAVTNWNANAAKTNYANSFSGVKWILMASTAPGLLTTQRRTWLSCADGAVNVTDIAGASQGFQSAKIRVVGDTGVKDLSNTTNVFVISSTAEGSYTYACSSAGADLATLGGTAAFQVEQDIPGTNRFFELKINNTYPPATQPGVFTMTSLGVLTFTSGTGGVAALPPQITQHPVSQTVRTGTNVSLAVVATGTPPLTYQWRLFGTNLPGQMATNLVLNNVTPAYAGSYTVVVSGSGSVTSSVAQLRVLAAPATVPASLAKANGQFGFSITSYTNLNYTLEYVTGIGNSWSNASATVPGTGNAINLQDSLATNSMRLYRIRVD